MAEIVVNEAKPLDFAAVREMVWQSHQTIYGGLPVPENEENFFEWAYSDETLNRLAHHPFTWQGVANDEMGEVVGYTVIQLDSTGAAELLRHYVSPTYQRQGIGSYLLNQAIVEISKRGPLSKVWLAVLRENPVGRSFYEKYGFVHERDEGTHSQFGPHESYYVYTPLGEVQDNNLNN